MPVVPAPGGHIHLRDGARKIWGTDEPPVMLVPDAWASIPITISFPDFAKDIAYGFNLFSSTVPFPTTTMYGMSIVKILPQTTWLPDIVLGSVPSALINYVDWRVVLSWTKQPSPARMNPVISPITPGVATDLRGGSGLIEISGCFRRMIHIGLSGTSIVLSRKQSTRHLNENPTLGWSPGNATHYPSGGPRPGWTYGVQQEGSFAHYIDKRAGGNNVWRGGSNSASLVDPTDYSSIWTGTLLVKPGRQNASI